MKRTLASKLAISSSVIALAFGAVACEVDDAAEPGIEEDPLLDDGIDDGLEDDGLDDGMDDEG